MNVGDKVVWESQAQGSWKEKAGTVIAKIPAGTRVLKHIPSSAKKSHLKFDSDISIYNRVLVEVPAGKHGDIMHYYAPKEASVKKQD